MKGTTYLLFFLLGMLMLQGCGSKSYLIDLETHARVTQDQDEEARSAPQPAVAEPSAKPVYVNPLKLRIERAEPLPDARLRVRPRRPTGHIIGGAITFGLGAILNAAGAGQLYCPPGYFCENGITVAALLGVGSVHMLVGGIVLIAGAAKWSPEVSPPGR